MSTSRTAPAGRRTTALVAHAAGWVALLLTAGAGRLGLLGDGGPRTLLLLGIGGLAFVALTAWGGTQLLVRLAEQPRPADAARGEVVAPLVGYSTLVGRYGRTTIRRAADDEHVPLAA